MTFIKHNTNTFEVGIIVLAILKFIDKETEIWQSEMTWLKTKTKLKFRIQFEFYIWYFFWPLKLRHIIIIHIKISI